jgi:SAM-dependent methyltransferase
MRVLLRAVFHLSRLRDSDIKRVAIIVDSGTGIDVHAVVALLRPWRSWLQIVDIAVASTIEGGEDWIGIAVAGGAQAVSVITERPEFAHYFEAAARRRGLEALGSDTPVESDRTTALFHEMSHHHFELGGLNEWNGNLSLHGSHVLQHISAANCLTHFPQYTIDKLHTHFTTLGRPLEALDIGCGAISRLRWGALQGLLNITGADPLLDVYEILLTYHGLDRLPCIKVDRAVAAGAEALDRYIAGNSIDFAFCCNALDHVEDPPAVIRQIGNVLRPGATFALVFATREGSRQDWRQLHQFDLFLDIDRNELMCQSNTGRLETLVPRDIPLAIDQVVQATDISTAVVLRHD